MGGALPSWIEHVPGAAPLLLVAPHGGRRPERDASELAAPRKANDLHTAELTLELARRTGATALVNRARDRNELDLNRVSDVRRGAPALLATLLALVREQIAERGEARLFFVHGWNAIQASCDVGIGGRLAEGRFVPVRESRPTIPERFFPALYDLAGRLRHHGIDVRFGDRYPAATKENLLQLFTERYAGDHDPAIRELARLGAAGRICAVQLELGIPLRWPGPLRKRLVDALARWLVAVPEATTPPPEKIPASPGSPRRISLEFHDGALGIGGFAATERAAGGRRFGRFLLCLGGSRLGLFTGEHPFGEALSCGALGWIRDGSALRLEYDGPFLIFPTTDPFLDLEAGLARSELAHLGASLEWRPLDHGGTRTEAGPGTVRGTATLDGATLRIEASATLGPTPSPSHLEHWRERRTLHVPLGDDLHLSLVSELSDREAAAGSVVRGGRSESLLSARVQVRRPGRAPEGFRIEIVTRSGPLRVFGQVTTAVPVVRTMDEHRTLTWFGLARFTAGERVGYGTFELTRRLTETGRARTGSHREEA